MNSGTGLNLLQKAEPDHYFDVGIAEQQAVLFAAGLALEGLKPVCAIYSTFLQRAFDQIVHDVCLQKLNVVFAMDRAGLVGDDGPTHHGAFDIAYLRCLPNIVAHGAARRGDARAHAAHRADLRRRPDRAALPARRGRRRPAAARESRRSRSAPARSCARARARSRSSATARGVQKALEAADLLAERGIEVTVADARFAKPLDAALLAAARRRARAARHGRGGRARGRLRLARCGRRCRRRRPGRAADPARRPARPLRHARQARAAARRGRLHRQGDRRAHRGRDRRVVAARSPAPERWPRSIRSSPSMVDAAALFEAATPEELPRDARRLRARRRSALGGALEPVARVEDVVIARPDGGAALPARAYWPTAVDPVGALVWLHGGGWCIGDLDGFDRVCRSLSNAGGATRGQRRLPPRARAPLPGGRRRRRPRGRLGDRPRRRAARLRPGARRVGGDSAGGNLAAVASLHAPGAPCAPSCSSTRSSTRGWTPAPTASTATSRCSPPRPSRSAGGRTSAATDPARATEPDASPLRADGPVRRRRRPTSRSPGTTSCTTRASPTPRALEAAGVPVTLRDFEDMAHGFIRWGGVVDRTRELIADLGAFARETLRA